MKTMFLINSKVVFLVLNKQKINKTASIIPLMVFLLFSINSSAQYVAIGKGKDSEGIKRVVKDEGFTSDFHKKHNKKIVFLVSILMKKIKRKK